MADVLHSTLTATDSHEPKDAETATVDTVYVSNGSGSGNWQSVPRVWPENTVIVNSLSDLPTPSGSIITLADDTFYLIGCEVDIAGNRFVMGTNSIMEGLNRNISIITSTATGSLFTSTNVDMRLAKLRFNAPSVSTLFTCTGTGAQTLRIEDVISIVHTGEVCSSTNMAAIIFQISLFIGGTDGISLVGSSNLNLVIDFSAFISFSGTAVDFGSSLWNDCSIKDTSFSGDVASIAISGLTASGNINVGRVATIDSCTFNGSGANLSGITSDDLQFNFQGNAGQENSHIVGGFSKDAGTSSTSLVTGTPVKLAGTTTLYAASERFDDDGGTDNRLKYLASTPQKMFINASVTGQASSSISCDIILRLNADSGTDVTILPGVEFDTGSDSSFSAAFVVDIEQSGFIELFITRTSGNQDLDSPHFSLLLGAL